MALTQISTAGVKDDAVTAGKIPANAVGSSELADNAVDTTALGTNAVTTAKIANNAVTAGKLASGVTDLSNDTSPQLGGQLDTNGNNIIFADGIRARFGTGNDLNLYHTSNENNIEVPNAGTGNLNIVTNGGKSILIKSGNNVTGSNNAVVCNVAGSVDLYHSGTKKFETTSTGVQVTGNIDIDGNIDGADGSKIKLGTGDDLQIFHSGSAATIDNNTGNLTIESTGDTTMSIQSIFRLQTKGGTEDSIKAITDGAVELYHNNSKKFETTSAGFALKEDNTTRLSFTYSNSLNFITANAGNEIKVSSGNGDANGIEFWDYTGVNKRCQIDGHGIKFNSDTAAANALDDYEEGSFTPILENDGSTTYSHQEGRYVKIGRLVHVNIFVGINNEDGGATNVTGIDNMPFINGASHVITFLITGNNGWDANLTSTNFAGWMNNGTSKARFYKNSGGNLNAISVNDIGSNGEIAISVTYQT